jgi:hypothetical protein
MAYKRTLPSNGKLISKFQNHVFPNFNTCAKLIKITTGTQHKCVIFKVLGSISISHDYSSHTENHLT